ncbi:MAG: PKD domain-containing protein [Candidatus Abawacabacteria bacterium]|nr:PKD domain-containing protein [Candidatus Abawacabacteria bacterium]
MKKFLLGVVVACMLFIPTTFAMTVIGPEVVSGAIIDSSDTVELNKNILFDASRSQIRVSNTSEFLWDFGDKSGGSGKEIIHTYNKPGIYTVQLTVNNGDQDLVAKKNIFVYERSQTILVDSAHNTPEIAQLADQLRLKNILTNIIQLDTSLSNSERNAIQRSIFIFVLANTGDLIRSQLRETLRDKIIILIADGNLSTLERLSKNSFSSIGANKIILASKAALLPETPTGISLLEAKNSAELTGILTNDKITFREVETQENIGIKNFMLGIINYLRQKGVPDSSLFLLLCIPFIVTIISFFRQFIGIATLGIYTPTIFTIAFLVIGGAVGSITFVIIALASILLRRIMRNMRIMYVPKMAIMLIGITVIMIALFVIATFFDYHGFITIDILPLILLMIMAERFVSLELERGLRSASLLFLETIVVSLAAYFILDSQKNTILAYPEVTWLMIPINYLIGKWTGLRVSEVLRFRDLIDSVEQDTEE